MKQYHFFQQQYTKAIAVLCLKQFLLCGITAYLFFESLWAMLALIPYFIFGVIQGKKKIYREELDSYSSQFRDALQCILACLEAGYSVENAFLQASKDLRLMFTKETPIVQGFDHIRRQLGNGANLEDLVIALGEESRCEDIENFAGIFLTAKRSGGDLIEVLRSVTDGMYQKHEVQREINTVLLAKQLEVRVMKVMPYGFLAYFRIFSPGFLDPLYQGVLGPVIMSVIFVAYVGCSAFADWLARGDWY